MWVSGRGVDDGQLPCQYQFEYWVKGKESQTKKPTTWKGSVRKADTFYESVTDLSPNTTYCFQAELQNGVGTSPPGGVREFTTQTKGTGLTVLSTAGGTVTPGTGTYQETIDFMGKGIKVMGTEPSGSVASLEAALPGGAESPSPSRTYGLEAEYDVKSLPVLDGQGTGAVVRFTSREGAGSVLSGLVISGGGGDVAGGWLGVGNPDADPLFAVPGFWADPEDSTKALPASDPGAVWVAGDYHLKSRAGRWDPAANAWVKDAVSSPCIDAGDPNSPTGEEPFPNGNRINVGAYGGTPQASLSGN